MANGDIADNHTEQSFKVRVAETLKSLRKNLFPTQKDNLTQIGIKLLFLISLIALICTAVWIIGYFSNTANQEKLVSKSREIWYNKQLETTDKFELLKAENSDFKAWLTADGADVDMPVYQGKDDEFYLNHNQQKKPNSHGALFLSCEDTLERYTKDKNFVIFGHSTTDSTMFSNLNQYRNIEVYSKKPNIRLTTSYGTENYKIYAVFLIDANLSENNKQFYNIKKSSFKNEEVFNSWVEEAQTRSIITTNTELQYGDDILTLVTDSNDFENACLVVMARRIRYGEDIVTDTSSATINPAPLYPKQWYDENGLKYPKGD